MYYIWPGDYNHGLERILRSHCWNPFAPKYRYKAQTTNKIFFCLFTFVIFFKNITFTFLALHFYRLWWSLWCEVCAVFKAKAVQEGMRDVLQEVRLRAAGDVWELRCLSMLCQHDHPRWPPQMPLNIHIWYYTCTYYIYVYICCVSYLVLEINVSTLCKI